MHIAQSELKLGPSKVLKYVAHTYSKSRKYLLNQKICFAIMINSEQIFNAIKTTDLKPFALKLSLFFVTYLLFRLFLGSGATKLSQNFLTL